MNLNLPNKLTIARACSVPVVAVFTLLGGGWRVAAFIFFLAACVTDFFDGRIARSRGLVTNFGKFLDPLADKLLVLCTMVCLTYLHQLPVWLVLIVIVREFCVDGLRMTAVLRGKVIAAGKLGKIKTVTQMTLLCLRLLVPDSLNTLILILSVLTALFTVLSGAEYFYQNRSLFSEQ